ncbi:hypothetical protein TCDM_11827 [Trypanosoma cruzi Dm28c]|uniref:Uncharacterized protein n=1 Tax=Trypanosoma cruzi Dm28c TaxID=1416333 RepID=V5CZK3_TRYCR|nr:hypothetical protein TCDM_11827 [Trypanosoma cruzi Dm28c]
MHRGHPHRSSNQNQHQKKRRTHSRNGPAPHTVPAARTCTHRRPHPPTHTSINKAFLIYRSRPVERNSYFANPLSTDGESSETIPILRYPSTANPNTESNP